MPLASNWASHSGACAQALETRRIARDSVTTYPSPTSEASPGTAGFRQENSRISTRLCIQFINIVTDLRHLLIFDRINPRRVFKVKGEDGIGLSQGRHRNWRHQSEVICRRNVLTPGSIRSCGHVPHAVSGGTPPLRPCVRAIHWTARSWALVFSLGTSTLAQGNLLVAATSEKSVPPIFGRSLANTPVHTERGMKSGNRNLARFPALFGDRLSEPRLACRGVVNTWQTRCLLTRLTLRRRGLL